MTTFPDSLQLSQAARDNAPALVAAAAAGAAGARGGGAAVW